jgi:hypothetical protein
MGGEILLSFMILFFLNQPEPPTLTANLASFILVGRLTSPSSIWAKDHLVFLWIKVSTQFLPFSPHD